MKPVYYMIIIGVLIAVILLMKACNSGRKPSVITNTAIDTVWRKEAVETPVYVPQPYAVYYPKEVPKYITKVVDGETKYIPVDTSEILRDYFAKVVYKDTVSTTYGTVRINDTLTQNRIFNRQVFTDFTIPEITKTVTISEPKRTKVFAGISTAYDYKFSLGPSLMVINKEGRRAYEIGAKTNGKTVTYDAGVKFLIKLKK